MGVNYPAMYSTTSIASGSQYITNNYKYMPTSTTTSINYDLNSNYIVNGAVATCFISPLERPLPTVPPAFPAPITPVSPVVKITVHTVEQGNSPFSYMMMIEQF